MKMNYTPEVLTGLNPSQQEQFELKVAYWFNETGRKVDVAEDMIFTVKPSPADYDATGLGGFCHNATNIDLNLTVPRFDLAMDKGIPTAVPHECHHAVRGYHGDTWGGTLMEAVVAEGLASAFESEVSGIQAPMSQYPPEVFEWLKEIKSAESDRNHMKWFTRPNKGRYHVGYKVGKYIVDLAVKNHPDQSASSLVRVSTEEVLELAGVN